MNADMTLVDVATKDLSGGALDWAVGTVERLPLALTPPNYGEGVSLVYVVDTEPLYRPSTDWSLGGPLITKYRVDVVHRHFITGFGRVVDVHACSCINDQLRQPLVDSDELVAVCRAVVSMAAGDTVKVPASLVKP